MKEKVEEDGTTKTTKQIKEYKDLLEKKVKQAQKDLKVERPDLYDVVAAKVPVIAYKRRPTGFSKVIPDIALCMIMTFQDSLNLTKKKLIDDVGKRHPKQNVTTSLLYRELQSYEKKEIEKKMRCSGIYDFKFSSYKNLSELHNQLKIYFHLKEEKPRKFKANISIHKDLVVIGKKAYPVTFRGSKNKEYPCIRVNIKSKRHWIRVDALMVALYEGEKG